MFSWCRKRTLSAWLYFSLLATQDGKVIVTEQDRPVCKMCGKRVLAKASNTTNLFQHLHEHHPTAYAELGPKKAVKREYSSSSSSQPILGSIITSSTLYSSNSPQAKDLNRAVAYHIAKDAMPLSTVDKPGFRFMISKLNPRYHLPSRKHALDHGKQNGDSSPVFSFVLDTKETSTKEQRGSPKGTDFEMANGRLAQQISAIL